MKQLTLWNCLCVLTHELGQEEACKVFNWYIRTYNVTIPDTDDIRVLATIAAPATMVREIFY